MSPQKINSLVFRLSILVLMVLGIAACSSASKASPTTPAEESELKDVARPSNKGGPGPALQLTGNAQAGAKVFADNCVPCHGQEGKVGVENPGSDDGTIPSLNPIDPSLVSSDPKTFAYNLDLFIEHGSTPEGTKPQVSMISFGDNKTLTPQQIADVIAYMMSLNKK